MKQFDIDPKRVTELFDDFIKAVDKKDTNSADLSCAIALFHDYLIWQRNKK